MSENYKYFIRLERRVQNAFGLWTDEITYNEITQEDYKRIKFLCDNSKRGDIS